MEEVSAIHRALTAANVPHSAMSWGGFNLFGDSKSIQELGRLIHEVGRLQAIIDTMRASSGD